MESPDRLLTFKEIEVRFGISRTTVWRWRTERGLKFIRIGGIRRVREGDLQRFEKAFEFERSDDRKESI